MKRTIAIDDTLQDNVDSAIAEVKTELLNYLEENTEDTWYLYASELEEAYENAGCGENPRENNGMAAIYYYIHEKVCEWYQNEGEELFEEWIEKLGNARDEGDHAGIADAEASRERGATQNPYGADTSKAFHEAWEDGYENGYESTID